MNTYKKNRFPLLHFNAKSYLKNTLLKQNISFLTITLLLFLNIFSPLAIYSQEADIEQTEDQLDTYYGIEKLEALNNLSAYYFNQHSRKGLKYGRQAVTIADNIFGEPDSNNTNTQREEQVFAYLNYAKALFDKGSYFDSKESLETAKRLSLRINSQIYIEEIDDYLNKIQALIDAEVIKENFFTKNFSNLGVNETINETTKDIAIQAEIKKAESDVKKNDFNAAINHYEKTIKLLHDKGDDEKIKDLQIKIAVLLDSLDRHEEAQKFLSDAINSIEKEELNEEISEEDDNSIYVYQPDSISSESKRDLMLIEKKNLKDLSESFANEKDFEKSLAYYKMYLVLSQKMVEDSMLSITEKKKKEDEILVLRQQKKIADLSIETIGLEKEKEVRWKNTSILIGLLILIATLITLYFYISKRKEHKKLTITYRDLDKTKGKLEEAEKRITGLLREQVSADVAEELLFNGSSKPGERRFVCIMFLDIRDFTPIAEKMSPEELIAYQNKLFGFMIDIVQHNHGTINQLLGDGFMASFGAPISHGNDCQNAFNASQDILKEIKERNEAGIIKKTRIGIGLHAGNVVTGNVGNESRKQYSVTGNTVIIASRIEQLNKTYKTQLILSEEVFENLENKPKNKHGFKEVNVKGRSKPASIMLFE